MFTWSSVLFTFSKVIAASIRRDLMEKLKVPSIQRTASNAVTQKSWEGKKYVIILIYNTNLMVLISKDFPFRLRAINFCDFILEFVSYWVGKKVFAGFFQFEQLLK
jgi:hypothetical protein